MNRGANGTVEDLDDEFEDVLDEMAPQNRTITVRLLQIIEFVIEHRLIGHTIVFAANVVGQPLALSEQVLVLVVVVLISIGTAGVPGAGIVMLTVILNQVGLPLAVVGFVAGVDPILGHITTMNKVTGDLAVATVVGKWNDAIDFGSRVWTR